MAFDLSCSKIAQDVRNGLTHFPLFFSEYWSAAVARPPDKSMEGLQ